MTDKMTVTAQPGRTTVTRLVSGVELKMVRDGVHWTVKAQPAPKQESKNDD